MKVFRLLYSFFIACTLFSCGAYKQNIMFQTTAPANLKRTAGSLESSYVIRKADELSLDVYTNNGERLADPNSESFKEAGAAQTNSVRRITYRVDLEGKVKFPLVGVVQLEGLTLRQAEELLQEQYNQFYKEPFVVVKFLSKRVVVLGTSGGQVIPLENPDMKLAEVLAVSKSITRESKANNIRVLRGEEVFVIDFSTVEGLVNNNLTLQPGDIVYVEPVRKPFIEALSEYGPVISTIASLGTLAVVIIQLNR